MPDNGPEMTPRDLTPPQNTPRVFIVCDQDATAPIWGYIIREKGLIAIVETSVKRAMQRSVEEIPDLIVIDVNAPHAQRMELCRTFRSLGASPILLFLPYNNESEILEAYQNGVDECVIKPISPAIFLAKIIAWSRRSWSEPMRPRHAGRLRLDPSHRSIIGSNKKETKLTNLEFRLLHLLMSRPGYVFPSEEIIQTVWGAEGDVIQLKNVIYRLRKKLEEETSEAHLIKTWPGGYSFVDE
ncbi:MAG: DNA-binding response regulator [Anaerolineaceae bacterium]|jgi:DNA-binding response OmpR family regulator|nr:MAG: DNA-binding response regulator [Anaerolineaceae bacterium]